MGDFFITVDELKPRVGTRSAPPIFDVCRAKAFGEESRAVPGARWREHTKVAELAASLPQRAEVVTYCVHRHDCLYAWARHARAKMRGWAPRKA